MSSEISRMQQMFNDSWDGPMWHGTNLKEVLDGIDFQRAFRKPAAGSHNIYELVMHMICWRVFVLELTKGNTSYRVEINSEQDWPAKYQHIEAEWNEALSALEENQHKLATSLSNFEDSKLEEPVPGRKFNWYALLHGLINHDIYHSAQISILKK